MRRTLRLIAGCLWLGAIPSPADAICDLPLSWAPSECWTAACDTLCSESNAGCDRWFLFPQSSPGINFHGWLNGGFVGNTASPNSRFHGPYNAVDRSDEGMLNQFYMVAEKELPQCETGLGMRVDALYGEDYFLAESVGMEKRPDGSPRWNDEYYGIAFPQAFVSIGSQNLSLQVGHFYSVVGYEGLMAPDNFFYTKSYSYQFADPFTHWGTQLNWSPSQAWTIQLGLHNGWDALDRVSDDVGFVGKIKYEHSGTGAWTSFAIVTGKDFNNPGGLPIVNDFTNRTRYSWIVSAPLTSRIECVFHHWLGLQEDGALGGGRADWYGIEKYCYYKLSECWKVGLRSEWFRDEEGTRVGLNRPSNPNNTPLPGNYYSLGLGVNWTPVKNLMIRPEFRADWYDGNVLPFDDGTDDNQFLLGLDAVLLF